MKNQEILDVQLFQPDGEDSVYLTANYNGNRKAFAEVFTPIVDGEQFDPWERAAVLKNAAQAQVDIGILLAQIDYFVDECGEELGEEDKILVEQIRSTHKPK